MPKIRIITMGCAKNEVDSDHMRALLQAAGYEVESSSLRSLEANSSVGIDSGLGDGEACVGLDDGVACVDLDDGFISLESGDDISCQNDDNASGIPDVNIPDATIINTCSFITEATQESIDAIFAVVDEKMSALGDGASIRKIDSKIVVAGCMPSRYGKDLEREIPEVDAFISTDEEDEIVEVINNLLDLDLQENKVRSERVQTARTTGEPFAFVKISDGCNRFCSFCTIPYIRGRYKSRPAKEIIDEVEFLTKNGVFEIVLIGQDTGVWGDDLCGKKQVEPLSSSTLPALLDYLAQTFANTWFRVMYLQPERIDSELLHVMASNSNICNYLDIPLQHASKKVIQEMNREGNGSEYLELLAQIRQAIPDVTLRTTLIAGFPGESDSEAAELVDFMQDGKFDFAGVFEYSQEDGTVAGERDDQIDPEVAIERANRVREVIEECSCASADSRVGKVYDVLVCGIVGIDDEFESNLDDMICADSCNNAPSQQNVKVWGRAMFQAPEVDSVIYFDAPAHSIGTFARVKVVDTLGLDLEGELV